MFYSILARALKQVYWGISAKKKDGHSSKWKLRSINISFLKVSAQTLTNLISNLAAYPNKTRAYLNPCISFEENKISYDNCTTVNWQKTWLYRQWLSYYLLYSSLSNVYNNIYDEVQRFIDLFIYPDNQLRPVIFTFLFFLIH